MNLRILLLKTEKFSGFLRLGSRLFHSIIVDAKKRFLKKLCFMLTRGGYYVHFESSIFRTSGRNQAG